MDKKLAEKKSNNDSDRMTVAEVAAYFNQSRFCVYNWIRLGQLPCKRTPSGRIAYIPRDAVTKFEVA